VFGTAEAVPLRELTAESRGLIEVSSGAEAVAINTYRSCRWHLADRITLVTGRAIFVEQGAKMA
jgi:hypothetical protein